MGTEATLGSSRFFLTARQSAFDAAWMNRDEVAVLDARSQGRQAQGWIFLTGLADKGKHLGGELVSVLGTALLGQQGRQASLLEAGLRLVKGRAGEAEGGRRLVHRQALGLDPAQHFVLGLNQVARIEKFP